MENNPLSSDMFDRPASPFAAGEVERPESPFIGGPIPSFSPQPTDSRVEVDVADRNGNLSPSYNEVLSGDVGQRLGYTQARDEGHFKEFWKGLQRGGVQFAQSMANTFGAKESEAYLNNFLNTNRQLYDSDRKDTWSYVANVAGSQISENLPMLAATIGAGLLSGGAGSVAGVGRTAAKVASIRTIAGKSAGAAMTGLMQWGNNLDELRERLPEMSESSRIALNMFLTPFQAWVEVGLGAEARTASEIGRLGLANELAKRAGMSGLKRSTANIGRLARFRETFAGKWLGVGAEETFEEFIQTAGMDALVNTMSSEKDWTNQEKWDGLVGKYKQLFKEAFIGGMALGVLPSTLNSYNNMTARRAIGNALKDNPDAVQKVDAGGVKVNGAWVMDTKRQQETLANFNGFFGLLGQGQLNPDPKLRTPVQKLFTTMFYNLASLRMDAETDPAKRANIKAEDSVKDLTILMARNPTLGPELINEISKPDATIESIATIVNKYDEKLGVTLGSVQDVVENGYAQKNADGIANELENQLATDDDNEMVVGAFKTLGGTAARGEKVVDTKKILTGDRKVPPSLLNKVAESVGDGFYRVLATGWIHNVVIRNAPPVSIKLEIDQNNGRLYGRMYTAEEAKEQIADEVESKEGLSDTGLTLAKTKLRLNRLQDSLRRIASWKKRSSIVEEPIAEPSAEEVAPAPEIPSTSPEDTAQRLKLLQDIKAEIAAIPVEDIVVEPSVAIDKFNERAAKAIPKAEGAPVVESAAVPVVDNTIAGQIAALEKEILTKVKGIKKSESPLAPAEILRRKTEDYFKQFAPAAVGPVKILHEDGETGVGLYKQDVPLSTKEVDTGRDTQLMAFLNGSDLGTIAHEIAHHLVEQELLPTPMMDALRKNFVVGVDKDRRMNQAEKENIANSFLQYVMQSKLPANADVAKAFSSMKAAIAGGLRPYFVVTDKAKNSGYFLNQFQSADTDQPETGASKLTLKPDVNQFFQSIFANITEDKIAQQYGHALRDSLLNGQVSDKYYFDDVQSIKTKMAELSSLSKQTPESVAQRIVTQYGDTFGNKTDLSKLDADERYALDRILDDELKAINPDRVKAGKDNRVSWERSKRPIYAETMADREKMWADSAEAKELRSLTIMQNWNEERLKGEGFTKESLKARTAELQKLQLDIESGTPNQRVMFERQNKAKVFVKKALIDTDGNIYDALPGETQHFQIETRITKDKPELKIPGALTSGYRTRTGEFVEALKAEKDGLFSLEKQSFEMQKRRDASRMNRSQQNSFFHNLFNDESIKDPDERQAQASAANHEFLQGLGFPADITQLTDEQVRTAIEEKQNEQSPIDAAELELPPETKEMSENLSGTRVTSMDEESLAGRVKSGFVRFGRRAVELITDPKTLVKFISNNSPTWLTHIVEPLSRIINDAERGKNEFYKIFHSKIVSAGANLEPLYENFNVREFRFTGSTMLDIYFMSNYGTELDNTSMTKFKAAHPDFFPEKMVDGKMERTNDLVQEIVDKVKNDANLVKIGAVMQEMNDLYFDRAATVKEKLSGEKPIKINRAYTSERTKGGLFISNDENDIAAQLQIFVPGLGNISMEPDALKHRGDVATGEYNLDSFGKFVTHIESLINYESKAQDIHRMLSSVENATMRDAFLAKFGSDDYRQALIKLLRREMSSTGTLKGASGLPLESSVSSLTNKAYTTFLSWNPMPIFTQLTTVFPALSALGINATPKLISNFTHIMRQFTVAKSIESSDAYKLADKLSPSIFSELFPKPSRDSIRQLLEQGRFSMKGMKTYVKYEQVGMKLMATSDMILRLATYQTAYEVKLAELTHSGKTEAEMSDIARSFAEETISKSHNPSSRSERGLLQSESSAFLKSSLAFTSQPFAMLKMFLLDTYLPLLSAYQKSGVLGVGKELGKNKEIWRKVALAGIVPGIALGAIGRRRPQKDFEEVWKDALIMGIGNSIPVIGQLLWASAVMGWSGKGRGFGGIYGQFMTNITDTLTDVLKGDLSFKTISSVRRTATLLAGVPDWPIRVMENLFKDIYIEGGEFDGKTMLEAAIGKIQD